MPIAALDAASEHAAHIVPERWARKYTVLPLGATDRRVIVATADPFDVECEHTLAFATGRDIEFHLAEQNAILRRIDEVYRTDGSRRAPERLLDVQLLGKEQHDGAPTTMTSSADGDIGRSVSNLVDELLAEAIAARASDLHV